MFTGNELAEEVVSRIFRKALIVGVCLGLFFAVAVGYAYRTGIEECQQDAGRNGRE